MATEDHPSDPNSKTQSRSRYDLERDLFFDALEFPEGPEREAFFQERCHDDPPLRRAVEDLLRRSSEDEDFLSVPAIAPVPEAQTEGPGSIIDNYKILEEIGHGGFGVVYRARQTQPIEREVALKILKLGMDSKEVIGRFEAERQALALMDHPNIAKVFDAGTTATGRPYFVMELVRGVPITRYCNQIKRDVRSRLEIFTQVCQAVQHAHQKGIIHRDIKPSNVLVTLHDGKPVPKVIDFGIAKATQGRLTDKTVLTLFHQFVGTPPYMSPEQAEMSGLDIDTRTDIYSLGVLLYELLTGRPPITEEELKHQGLDAIRRRIREEEPTKPSLAFSTLTDQERATIGSERSTEPKRLAQIFRGDLDWILLKALEKDRTRRYETADAFRNDIERFLKSEPVSAVAPTTVYKIRKYARRHTAQFAAAAVAALSLVAATVVSTSFAIVETNRRQEVNQLNQDLAREQEIKTLNLYAADVREAQNEIRNGNFQGAENLLKPYTDKPSRGWELGYLLNQAKGDPHLIVTNLDYHGIYASDITTAQDLLALSSMAGDTFVWSLRNNTLVFREPEPGAMNLHVSISPQGDHLAVGRMMPTPTGNLPAALWSLRHIEKQPATESVDNSRVRFSPRFNWLATSEPSDRVQVKDLDSGSLIYERAPQKIPAAPTSQYGVGAPSLAFSKDGQWLAMGTQDNRYLEVVDLASGEVQHSGIRLFADPDTPPGNFTEGVWGLELVAGNRFAVATFLFGPPLFLDLASGTSSHLLGPEAQHCHNLRESPDGRLLAGACFDHTIRLWSTETFELLQTLRGCRGEVGSLEFFDDGSKLVAVTTTGEISYWDITDEHEGARRLELEASGDTVRPLVVFSEDESTLFVANNTQAIEAVGLESGTVTTTEIQGIPVGYQEETQALVTISHPHNASGTLDVRRQPLDPNATGSRLTVPITESFEFITDVKHAYCASKDRFYFSDDFSSYTVYQVDTAREIDRIELPESYDFFSNIGVSPDGSLVVMAANHGGFGDLTLLVHRWDSGEYQLEWELPAPVYGSYPENIEISRDNRWIALSANQRFFYLVDLENPNPAAEKKGWSLRGCNMVRFSPDSKSLVSSDDAGFLRVWHLATERQLMTIEVDFVPSRLAFSPKGKWMAALGGRSMATLNALQWWRVDSDVVE